MKPIIQTLQYQKGVTLISLLVGLFISMLCILGSLTLYKNLIQVATESKIDTLHDGQLAAAMLTMQLELQSAGYGIENAGVNDVVKHRVSGGTANTIELLWRFNDGTVQCRGLKEDAVTDSETGLVYRVLNLRQVSSGCNTTTNLTSMTWENHAVLAQWPVVAGLKPYIDTHGTLLDFDVAPVACSPFGAMDQQPHLRAQISAPSSAVLNGVPDAQVTRYDFCLPNTR